MSLIDDLKAWESKHGVILSPEAKAGFKELVANLMVKPEPCEGESIPAVLFDGYAVLQEIIKHDRLSVRTPDQVSDVLDAVVRLIKSLKEG